jgi:GDSL-like Lipase/Acylhydrolase family
MSVPPQPTTNPQVTDYPGADLSRREPSTSRKFSRSKELLFILVALTFSLLVTLMLGEVIVRMAAPQDLSGTWLETAPRGYLRNKSGGTARHQFGQRVVHYRFNDRHMRGGTIGAGEVRVLALGESFTFGWLLEEQNTYLARLQQHADAAFGADQFEILNGAAGGWGTEDYVLFLEDEGDLINPNVVLVFLGIDDTERAMNAPLYRLVDRHALTLEPTGVKVHDSRLKQFANSVPGYELLLEHSHLMQFLRKESLRGRPGVFAAPQTDRSSAPPTSLPVIKPDDASILKEKALFLRIANWCRQHHALMLVVTNWPADQRFTLTPAELNQRNITFRAQADQFFRENGIDFFDPGPQLAVAFGGRLDQYRIHDDGHPTEAGAALIGDTIWPWLEPKLRPLAVQ